MSYYIDTSMLVTVLDKEDPLYDNANKFLLEPTEKIISPLVITELASVLSRKLKEIKFHKTLLGEIKKLTPFEKILFIVSYLLKKFNLKLVSLAKETITHFGVMPAVFSTALWLSVDVKLRTLDLLHLAYATLFKRNNYPITAIATLDEDFYNKRREITKATNLTIYYLS